MFCYWHVSVDIIIVVVLAVVVAVVLLSPCLFLYVFSPYPKIHKQTLSLINGYIQSDKLLNHIDKYIVKSRFNDDTSNTTSGAVGALHMGMKASE